MLSQFKKQYLNTEDERKQLLKNNYLDEIIRVDEVSDTESLVGYTMNLPKIPKTFAELFNGFQCDDENVFEFNQTCDCNKV